MSDLVKLAPLAIGLVVFGLVVAYLLQRGMVLGTWLLAVFLLGHGLVHVMFAVPAPAAPASGGGMDYPFNIAQSWLVTNHFVDIAVARILVIGLIAVTVVGFGLTALATVGIGVPQAGWPALLVASTAASAVLMIIGLTPALALGVAIDAVLLILVFTSAWRPTTLPA